jgi:hypothetical protein
MEDKRRKPEGEDRSYELTKIWDTHHEIMRMLVLGYKPEAIAEQLGITTQTVSNVRNNPMVKKRMLELQLQRDASVVEIRKQVVELVPKAVQVLDDVMTSDNAKHSDKLRAALGVLDNTLPKQSDLQVNRGAVSSDDIKEIINRGRVDAEFEVEDVKEEIGENEEISNSNPDVDPNPRG